MKTRDVKRVQWEIGQPLLPSHLYAQEESLLAHVENMLSWVGLPRVGVIATEFDLVKLANGVISINKLAVVFTNGELVEFPSNTALVYRSSHSEPVAGANSKGSLLDISKCNRDRVKIYLHLLSEKEGSVSVNDTLDREEEITYTENIIEVSDSPDSREASSTFCLCELETVHDSPSAAWRLCPNYIPPLLSVNGNPFLVDTLLKLKNAAEKFKNQLKSDSENADYTTRTMASKLSLASCSRLLRVLGNVQAGYASHPYSIYSELSTFLEALDCILLDRFRDEVILYDHDDLGSVFNLLLTRIEEITKVQKNDFLSLKFAHDGECYVSPTLHKDLEKAGEVYLIFQPDDHACTDPLEEYKLASYSGLSHILAFGLKGVDMTRQSELPFDHNFDSVAHFYKVHPNIEWEKGLKEGQLAFSREREHIDLQVYIYYR